MASIINLNDGTPSPPTGVVNVKWQGDSSTPRNVSAYMPLMIGDADPSSPLAAPASGAVRAPAAGDAAAGKFLRADGTWAVPSRKVAAAFTSATSVTFTHNLGTVDITFAVWDAGGNQLLPQSVVVTSINVLTLGFGVAVSGRVVVIG